MKKLTKITICLLLFIIFNLNIEAQNKINYDRLIEAIGQVESNNKNNATNGKHVGFLQISPILVDECNNILKRRKSKKRFHYNDRRNKKKSIEMFYIIQEKYNPKGCIETAIRLWNGGCNWYKNTKKTDGYFKKVMKAYNNM